MNDNDRRGVVRKRISRWPVFLLAALSLPSAFAQQPTQAEVEALQRQMMEMQRAYENQQRAFENQMRAMRQQIERLQQVDAETKDAINETQEKVAETQEKVAETQERVAETQSTVSETQVMVAKVEKAVDDSQPLTSSGSDKLRLTVSGQVNRAFNVVDDGDDTKFYAVDNDVTNTRVRWVGVAELGDTTVKSVLEQALSANNSYDVSQDNESTSDFLDTRKAELVVRNDRYGAFYAGKGQGAADDVAEYDLTLVGTVLMYSGVSDVVGGIQFTADDELTGQTLGDGFFNFDGERYDRAMYESPAWKGWQLALSGGEDQRWDAALKFGYDYGDWSAIELGSFTTMVGLSISDPSDQAVDYRWNGSISTIHNDTGLGLSLAAGGDEAEESGRDDPYMVYGKVSWDTNFFDFGDTGFGLDFQYNENQLEDDDSGYSVGFAALQEIRDASMSLYAQMRYFNYDNDDGPSFESVWAGTTGIYLRF